MICLIKELRIADFFSDFMMRCEIVAKVPIRLLSLMVCNTKTSIIKPNKDLRGRNNNRYSFYVSLKITIQMCSMQERFTHIKSQRIELLLVMGTSTFTRSTCARYISFYSDPVNELIWWWRFLKGIPVCESKIEVKKSINVIQGVEWSRSDELHQYLF